MLSAAYIQSSVDGPGEETPKEERGLASPSSLMKQVIYMDWGQGQHM